MRRGRTGDNIFSRDSRTRGNSTLVHAHRTRAPHGTLVSQTCANVIWHEATASGTKWSEKPCPRAGIAREKKPLVVRYDVTSFVGNAYHTADGTFMATAGTWNAGKTTLAGGWMLDVTLVASFHPFTGQLAREIMVLQQHHWTDAMLHRANTSQMDAKTNINVSLM